MNRAMTNLDEFAFILKLNLDEFYTKLIFVLKFNYVVLMDGGVEEHYC